MTLNLSEEEMRKALFGSAGSVASEVTESLAAKPVLRSVAKAAQRKSSSPRLRVTLKVTKTFDGVEENFTYDANTLSSLIAEQEAKSAAKKKRYKYFEVVSIGLCEHRSWIAVIESWRPSIQVRLRL
ncbi:hypothetical protein SAMN03159382_04134 [Pseudomonas sp. NFACC23-1]|uniref:hypothetical protein n=1 Tax=unclassified Pseudomonas TaxID=196821 RepID=UPI0008846426|nr:MULTISPECIES: hypothetical protein [unclassified Pseudomonas]SDB53747.1 hypothetical protein SAMN03159386_04098 [Pseudomonas sp. NFACC17-2]SEJ74510.1 hypothetical protein SAMN03159382_04134 [Pseudomonas sp. NFACC23-1]SFW86189.1 hypothetical protein SAMN05660640_04483 [Pseudomonas sp. NFACC16-2]